MAGSLARACFRPARWSGCLRFFTACSSSTPFRLLHSSTSPSPLEPQATTTEASATPPLDSSSPSPSPSSHPTPSSASPPPAIRSSQWHPGNPFDLSHSARKSLRRRLRHTDPSRPHLSTFAHLDTATTPPSLRYTYPPPDARPRKYQLHVPQQRTTFSFRITHASKEYIQQATEVFEEQALKLNLRLDSVVPLPTRVKRWTLLRSPHVDKQSREQLEIKRHKRLITLTADTPHAQQQVVKLLHRTTGMASGRVTMTARFPAGQPIRTLTFGDGDGEGAGQGAGGVGVAGWEDDDEWEADGYEMEDEVELTEEEENWGEELELEEDVEEIDVKMARSAKKA